MRHAICTASDWLKNGHHYNRDATTGAFPYHYCQITLCRLMILLPHYSNHCASAVPATLCLQACIALSLCMLLGLDGQGVLADFTTRLALQHGRL
jgi:hypothetical protein